jgi:hypothetical protein
MNVRGSALRLYDRSPRSQRADFTTMSLKLSFAMCNIVSKQFMAMSVIHEAKHVCRRHDIGASHAGVAHGVVADVGVAVPAEGARCRRLASFDKLRTSGEMKRNVTGEYNRAP